VAHSIKEEQLKEDKDKKERGEVSRRDFLIGAGAVVVGGAVGAGIAYPLASGGDGEVTTVTSVKTVPTTVTTTATGGAGATVTETVGAGATVTAPGSTVTITQPGGDGAVEPAFELETTFLKRSNSDGRNASACEVKNGKIVRIRPHHWDDEYTEAELKPIRGARAITAMNGHTFDVPLKSLLSFYHTTFKKRVYSPNRILYPLQRVDWEPGGDITKTNPQNRGKSKYKRISWDEATDIISSEIKRITNTYTPWAILCQMDAHGETKQIHAKHGCGMRLLRQYNDGYTQQMRNPDSWEGWYWGAKHFWGDGWMGQCKQVGPLYSDILKNARMCIYEGHDPATQVGCYFGQFPSLFYFWFQEAGGFILSIAPDLNFDSAVKCRPYIGKWIPVLGNTDIALHLAIAYHWLDKGTYDQEYLDTHSVGFDSFKSHVLGEDDGIPKTPAWAAPICGVTEWTIKAMATEWANKPTTTCHREGGPQRGAYSHETARIEAYCMGMQGLGKPGQHSYATPHGMPRWEMALNANGARFASGFAYAGWAGAEDPQIKQHIAKNLIHEAILKGTVENPFSWMGTTLLRAPVEDQFQRYYYPIPASEGGSLIHMVWTDAPCNTVCWNNGFHYIEAYRSPQIEFFLGQHAHMENDMLLSDIIMPVNTKYEEEDIQGVSDEFAFSYLMYEGKAIESVGESKSDLEAVEAVAAKLGEDVRSNFMGGKTVAEWVKAGFDNSGAQDLISFEDWKAKQYFTQPAADDWQDDKAGLIDFYNDPDSDPIGLPSGKLEYYSERLAEAFPDDKERNPSAKYVCGGPASEGWYHDESLYGERCKTYPIICESNHPRWRFHAQFDDVPWFREIATGRIKGYDGYMYESTWINPETAAQYGIETGDIIKMWNERGTVLGGAYVTERVRPGMARQDHGARLDLINSSGPESTWIDRAGSNNLITPLRVSSPNATGMVVQGFLIQIEKLDPAEMEGWRKQYPEAFARDYDPAYGPLFTGWVEGGM